MADIPGIIATFDVCPDVVTPPADKQMLQLAIRNLVGISDADRVAGTNPLWMAFAEMMGIQSFLGDLITLTEHGIMDL